MQNFIAKILVLSIIPFGFILTSSRADTKGTDAGSGIESASSLPHLETLLPQDCDIVLLLNDFPSLRADWEKSPLFQAWNDPQVKKFFAPLRQKIAIDQWDEVVEKNTGHTLKALLDLFPGQVALAITDLKALIESEEENIPATE